jgi:hypothetical protein
VTLIRRLGRAANVTLRRFGYADPALQRHGIQSTWHYLFEAKC